MRKNNFLKNIWVVLVFASVIVFVAACGSSHYDSSDNAVVRGGGDIFSTSGETGVPQVDGSQEQVVAGAPIMDDWAYAFESPAEVWFDWGEDSEEPWENWEPEPIPDPPTSAQPTRTEWETPEAPVPAATQRRVIRNSSLSVDTLHFDETRSDLERVVALNGGFIETSSQRIITTRLPEREFWQAEFVIRVPVDRFDAVNEIITDLGQVTRFVTNSEDVTMLFLDLQSRLAIRVEEERRVEAMRDAAANLQDLLALERQLSDLRIVVDRYRRRMTEIDRLASFSTIRVSIREAEEDEEYAPYITAYPPNDFGTRIISAFDTSVNFSVFIFEIFAVIVATLILPLSLLAVPVFGGFKIYKKLQRSNMR